MSQQLEFDPSSPRRRLQVVTKAMGDWCVTWKIAKKGRSKILRSDYRRRSNHRINLRRRPMVRQE